MIKEKKMQVKLRETIRHTPKHISLMSLGVIPITYLIRK